MGAAVFFQSTNELARLTNTFTVSGTPTDPTTVGLDVTDPTGLTTSYTYSATISKSGTGVYYKDVPCGIAGEWAFVWTGTGAAADVTAGTFTVQETTIGRLYSTVGALKSRLGITSTDTADDYELHAACFAASRSIESHTGRLFWRTAAGTARYFDADNMHTLTMPAFCDLVAVTEVAIDSAADGTYTDVWSASDYQLLPLNPSAAPEQRPYDAIRGVRRSWPTQWVGSSTLLGRVRVTGTWGWPAVPWPIRQAALILAQETFKAKDTFGGVAGFGEFGVVRLRENPLLESFVGSYTRMDAYG